ncbi:hypothetical protein LRS06_18870 [Hymenobacter sp. J193]|uniref:hypothetical protein n=1 Tax=Hymenobacter sp. J193 TaxID=2898429 RepID=UPI00215165FE|nr:hypothetical protein [Hymenobacter sp. J193]MCR5889794.1 hypothetical protein [Hymenobacter sp. J193]
MLAHTAGQAQRLSAATRKAVIKLRHSRLGQDNTVGYGMGSSCPADSLGRHGLCQATNAELTYLSNQLKPSLRTYAFSILVRRRAPEVFPLLLTHLRDGQQMWARYSHHGRSSVVVGDFWLALVNPGESGPGDFTLTPAQQVIIDSLLLFQPSICLEAQAQLLSTLPVNPRYYRRVRHLAHSAWGTPAALLPLARYQRAADRPLIRRSLGYRAGQHNSRGQLALEVVQTFPHETYYPKLRRLFSRNLAWKYYNADTWRWLCLALARYPRAETVQLFQQIFRTGTWRQQQLQVPLQAALLRYPSPQWQPVQEQLHLTKYDQEKVQEYLAQPE